MSFPHRYYNKYYFNIRFTTKFKVDLFCLFIILPYFLPFISTPFHFLCTRKNLLGNVYQFKPIKTSILIILQVILEIILDEVYGLIAAVILKLYSKSCCRNIYLYDDIWDMIWINFEILSQLPPSY